MWRFAASAGRPSWGSLAREIVVIGAQHRRADEPSRRSPGVPGCRWRRARTRAPSAAVTADDGRHGPRLPRSRLRSSSASRSCRADHPPREVACGFQPRAAAEHRRPAVATLAAMLAVPSRRYYRMTRPLSARGSLQRARHLPHAGRLPMCTSVTQVALATSSPGARAQLRDADGRFVSPRSCRTPPRCRRNTPASAVPERGEHAHASFEQCRYPGSALKYASSHVAERDRLDRRSPSALAPSAGPWYGVAVAYSRDPGRRPEPDAGPAPATCSVGFARPVPARNHRSETSRSRGIRQVPHHHRRARRRSLRRQSQRAVQHGPSSPRMPRAPA